MKIEKTEINGKNFHIIEFLNIGEFCKYLNDTPYNKTFENHSKSSKEDDFYFTQTKSYDEALELLKNGWSDMSKKLTTKLNNVKTQSGNVMKQKTVYDVQGFQCSVPMYLNGIPTNMISKKNVTVKQKVVTINKSISYSAGVKTNEIIDESLKALQIVKKLESMGIRVNLNICQYSSVKDFGFLIKIRVKSSNEKLNVSKLAFPMVHPSMLRRLIFNFIEKYPDITSKFLYGYGMPGNGNKIKNVIPENEYVLPTHISKNVDEINNLDDLQIDRYGTL